MTKLENLRKYDHKPYHFGFLLAANTMDFVIKSYKNFNNYDSLYVLESSPKFGFNIGIIADLTLGKYFNMRFLPTLSFGERTLHYKIKNSTHVFYQVDKNVESTYLDFPFILKFKSMRLNNFRAYVTTGVKYCFDLASLAKKNENPDEIVIKLRPHDISFELGVGFDFYTVYFKFGTQIQMSYGILNLLKRENNLYTNTIERLNSKIFQLSFTFE